jgi:hypothetical protein
MRKRFRVTHDMRSRDIKTAALAYARAGLPVLGLYGISDGRCDCGDEKCSSAGKHPIGALFPRGFKDATTDVNKIERLFKNHHNANIGLVPTDDLLIIDVDGSEGEASIKKLSLPDTAAVITGRGRHLYFACEGLDDWKPPRLKGIDFRLSDNGYVVTPPSRHIAGKRYRWRAVEEVAATVTLATFKARGVIPVDFSGVKERIKEGGRNSELTRIAGMLRAAGAPKKVMLDSLMSANREMCEPPLSRKEVEAIARSISRYPSSQEKAFADIADVEVEEVMWLYAPYFPRGVIVLLDGRPGLGKSNFCVALVAAITTGRKLPWSDNAPRGKVLILSAEDDPARVLKPRLTANRADLGQGRVRFAKELFSLDEAGIALLRAEIASFRPDLVIIDPIIAYMSPGAEINKATDMTKFMADIDAVAREFDCTILIVRHLRKSGDGDAMMQGIGSVALAGRVRSMLVMGKHPDDPKVKAVAHAKSNYGPEGPTFTFEIGSKKGVPVIRWLGVDENLSADQLVQPPAQNGPGRPAVQSEGIRAFLEYYLAGGERDSKVVLAQAKARSFAEVTVRRVARQMGIVMRRNGGVKSFWSLRES